MTCHRVYQSLAELSLHWAVSFDSMDEPQQEFSLLRPDATISIPSGTQRRELSSLYIQTRMMSFPIYQHWEEQSCFGLYNSVRRGILHPAFSLQMPETMKPRHPSKKSKRARKSHFVDMNDVVSYIPTLGGAFLNWAVQFWPQWDEEPQVDDEWLSNVPDAAMITIRYSRYGQHTIRYGMFHCGSCLIRLVFLSS